MDGKRGSEKGSRTPPPSTSKEGAASKEGSTSRESPAALTGMRLSVDFISPIIVGIFMGFWLDRWLSTTPLFLLILFFLGILAGFWNLYRMAQRLEQQNE